MAPTNDSEFLELMRQVRDRPTYSVYQRVGARLSELDEPLKIDEGRQVKIAVLSSYTLDPIKPYLQIGCLERSISPDIFLPGFNQFAQQIYTPDSELYRFNPDICFLHIFPEALVDGLKESEFQAEHIGPLIQGVKGLVEAFRSQSQADLVVLNFAVPSRFPYALQIEKSTQLNFEAANEELESLAKEIPGVHILDYESLTAHHGKDSVSDERWRHIARMELNGKFLPKLANKMLATILALRGLGRKCIVLDLDDTLWGGVVGEEGLAGLQLGPDYPGSAFVEFQQALLALQRRGILLAINSKNNEQDGLEVIEQHPSMVLRPEHFAAKQINWHNKCENIEAIANELNLGLEAMVFIDDNPAERELMRLLRPEVLTPEWPQDVVQYRTALEWLCDFASMSVTAEDENRSAMYTAEAQRGEAKNRSASLEDYLFGLKMELFINQVEPDDLPRFHQLLQKTNQFNLTTRRYSAAECQTFLHDDNVAAYVLRNQDAFGDNGLVGIAVVKRDGPDKEDFQWRVDTLLMSCRVLGRTIETGFLNYILEQLKARGCRTAVGEFIPTSKNSMVKDFYPNHGFVIAEEEEFSLWVADLVDYAAPELPWLSINPRSGSNQMAVVL